MLNSFNASPVFLSEDIDLARDDPREQISQYPKKLYPREIFYLLPAADLVHMTDNPCVLFP